MHHLPVALSLAHSDATGLSTGCVSTSSRTSVVSIRTSQTRSCLSRSDTSPSSCFHSWRHPSAWLFSWPVSDGCLPSCFRRRPNACCRSSYSNRMNLGDSMRTLGCCAGLHGPSSRRRRQLGGRRLRPDSTLRMLLFGRTVVFRFELMGRRSSSIEACTSNKNGKDNSDTSGRYINIYVR